MDRPATITLAANLEIILQEEGLEMVFVIPDSRDRPEQDINSDQLRAILDRGLKTLGKNERIHLSLPKFKLEQETRLTESLRMVLASASAISFCIYGKHIFITDGPFRSIFRFS